MIAILLPLLLLAAAIPASAGAQTACAPDHPAGRARVHGYLTQDNFADHRRSLGIDGYTPAAARPLVDSTDAAVCERLLVPIFQEHRNHPNWKWSAYQVGSYYFLTWRYVNTNGGFRIGISPWFIFDRNFVQVGGFGS